MIDMPPTLPPFDLDQVLLTMSDEDKQHLAELVVIRMSAQLYEYVAKQSRDDNMPFGEWIRHACVFYGRFRELVRFQKNKEINE